MSPPSGRNNGGESKMGAQIKMEAPVEEGPSTNQQQQRSQSQAVTPLVVKEEPMETDEVDAGSGFATARMPSSVEIPGQSRTMVTEGDEQMDTAGSESASFIPVTSQQQQATGKKEELLGASVPPRPVANEEEFGPEEPPGHIRVAADGAQQQQESSASVVTIGEGRRKEVGPFSLRPTKEEDGEQQNPASGEATVMAIMVYIIVSLCISGKPLPFYFA